MKYLKENKEKIINKLYLQKVTLINAEKRVNNNEEKYQLAKIKF
jgi:hypothetical protein